MIRIGMIGCGGIARHHLGQLARIEGVKVVALQDPDAEQIKRCQASFPQLVGDAMVLNTADWKQLLALDEVDAVEICTPHTQHGPQALDAIAAKKHVLLEKPMVSNVAEAHTLLNALEGYEKIFALAYQRHSMGQFKLIREKIASGEMGQVTSLNALQSQSWKNGTAGSWRQIPELSGGGQINDSGSHLVDILLYTTGLTVAQVAAFQDFRGTPVDIDSVLSIRFTNGALGNVSVIGDTVVGWHEDISIWCEKGAFFYRNGQLTIVDDKNVRTIMDGNNLPGTQNIDENFVGAIRGENGIGAPPLCGLRTIEMTEAAWESAKLGGAPVKMN
ncbi:Gfo/Idh/MocA family protein [Armatimonas sp.]|uniref:Gfo/Idh/MocA family protein n=1 Tax=Armatimonas sp. TaxID=1872638 RepID=UPI00375245ED